MLDEQRHHADPPVLARDGTHVTEGGGGLASTGSGSIRLGAGGSAADSNRGSAFACTIAEAGLPGGEGSPTSVNS